MLYDAALAAKITETARRILSHPYEKLIMQVEVFTPKDPNDTRFLVALSDLSGRRYATSPAFDMKDLLKERFDIWCTQQYGAPYSSNNPNGLWCEDPESTRSQVGLIFKKHTHAMHFAMNWNGQEIV